MIFFGDYGHFLCLKLSYGTIVAANIGQAMVNLKLWLRKSSSSHRQLHGGRGLSSQSLACEPHTLPLGYHAKYANTSHYPYLIEISSHLSIKMCNMKTTYATLSTFRVLRNMAIESATHFIFR